MFYYKLKMPNLEHSVKQKFHYILVYYTYGILKIFNITILIKY